jgi:hypothetical protein
MAQSLDSAELFPGCVQLTVTGNGTIELTGNEFANFPGTYKPKDPGIFVGVRKVDLLAQVAMLIPRLQAYTNFPGDKYQFPGPPVVGFV